MPVDFNRVPPRVDVPPAPRPSLIVWLSQLALFAGAGAALAIVLWPAGMQTNTLWFWVCVAGYPVMTWAVVLLVWLGYRYIRRNQAIATNRVSDKAEQACHDAASRPLAILGHAWCFSADETENAAENVRGGSVAMHPRPSAAVGDTEVLARWLEIPDLVFSPGNEQSEIERHQTVGPWLLERLLNRLTPALAALPPRTRLLVEMSLCATLDAKAVESLLRERLATLAPTMKFAVKSEGKAIGLFRTDAWADRRDPEVARLLIAIELRDAISAVLSGGVAEAGVALLVGHPRLTSAVPTQVRLHRPSRGTFDAANTTLKLAARWGRSSVDHPRTVWSHGLTLDQAGGIRQAATIPDGTPWIALESSVGDCSRAAPWLAVALAAESARATGQPQFVLCNDGERLVALVCKKLT